MGGSVYEPITRQNLRENKLPTKFLVFSASLFDMRYERLYFLWIYIHHRGKLSNLRFHNST